MGPALGVRLLLEGSPRPLPLYTFPRARSRESQGPLPDGRHGHTLVWTILGGVMSTSDTLGYRIRVVVVAPHIGCPREDPFWTLLYVPYYPVLDPYRVPP